MPVSSLLALTLSAAPAPYARPLEPDAIVVEGRKTKERASDYVDKVLPTTFAGQFGRFEDPLCVKTAGLSETVSREVVDRMRLVAKSVGMQLGARSCAPNLILITTADKKAMIEALRKSRPSYVSGISSEELNRQASSPRPFATWQMVETVGADGMRIGGGDSL